MNEVLPTEPGDDANETGRCDIDPVRAACTAAALQLPAASRVRMWKYLLLPVGKDALVADVPKVSTVVSGSVLEMVSNTYE